MLEVAEALAAVLEHARPRRPEAVPLSPVVLGRVLAADATADRDSPPFDKSLRDGYAVRSAECAGGAELRVIEEVPSREEEEAARRADIIARFLPPHQKGSMTYEIKKTFLQIKGYDVSGY